MSWKSIWKKDKTLNFFLLSNWTSFMNDPRITKNQIYFRCWSTKNISPSSLQNNLHEQRKKQLSFNLSNWQRFFFSSSHRFLLFKQFMFQIASQLGLIRLFFNLSLVQLVRLFKGMSVNDVIFLRKKGGYKYMTSHLYKHNKIIIEKLHL